MALLSQGRTAAAQCGLFTHKPVPVIFEPPFTFILRKTLQQAFGLRGRRWICIERYKVCSSHIGVAKDSRILGCHAILAGKYS